MAVEGCHCEHCCPKKEEKKMSMAVETKSKVTIRKTPGNGLSITTPDGKKYTLSKAEADEIDDLRGNGW